MEASALEVPAIPYEGEQTYDVLLTGEAASKDTRSYFMLDSNNTSEKLNAILPSVNDTLDILTERLEDGQGPWLTDVIMRAYMGMIMNRLSVTDVDASLCDVGFIGPGYQPAFERSRDDTRHCTMKPTGFNAIKRTLVILNPGEYHWILLNVDNRSKTAHVYKPNRDCLRASVRCAQQFIEL